MTKTFQKELSEKADDGFSHMVLEGGLSINLPKYCSVAELFLLFFYTYVPIYGSKFQIPFILNISEF